MAPSTFAENVLQELRDLVSAGLPVFTSERGELFVSRTLPMGAVKLSVPVEEYLKYLDSLEKDVRPRPVSLSIVEGEPFQIVITGLIVEKNTVTIEERLVTVL